MSASMLCEHCSKEAQFCTQLAPFGTDPGYRIYRCDACDHLTWARWGGSYQQQQQPRKKD